MIVETNKRYSKYILDELKYIKDKYKIFSFLKAKFGIS